MRLPAKLLACVRGPVAIAALVACSAPAAAPVVPEPSAGPAVQAPPPPVDPVAYDALAEAGRLERADRELASELRVRDDRIHAAERAATLRDEIGWTRRMMIGCGRG